MNSSSSVLPIINFFIIILIIFFLFIVYFESRKGINLFYGTTYRIQDGLTTGKTDTFNTSKFDLYVGNSSSALTLTILSSPTNIVGHSIYIKNESTQTITLQSGSGVSLNKGQFSSLTIPSSQTVSFVVYKTSNNFLRLT